MLKGRGSTNVEAARLAIGAQAELVEKVEDRGSGTAQGGRLSTLGRWPVGDAVHGAQRRLHGGVRRLHLGHLDGADAQRPDIDLDGQRLRLGVGISVGVVWCAWCGAGGAGAATASLLGIQAVAALLSVPADSPAQAGGPLGRRAAALALGALFNRAGQTGVSHRPLAIISGAIHLRGERRNVVDLVGLHGRIEASRLALCGLAAPSTPPTGCFSTVDPHRRADHRSGARRRRLAGRRARVAHIAEPASSACARGIRYITGRVVRYVVRYVVRCMVRYVVRCMVHCLPASLSLDAMPKSAIFTSPPAESRRLADFISRWTMRQLACSQCSPRSVSVHTAAIMRSSRGVPRCRMASHTLVAQSSRSSHADSS